MIDNYYSNTLIDVTVKLCGEWGDPAMHPDLADIVQYAANKMHIDSVIINTNGGLRSATFWTSLYYNTTDSNASVNVMWGIDGSTHYYNDMYRRNVNTARAFENMHAWFDVSNDNGMWQYLAFAWNYNDWESAYNYSVMHNIPFKFAIGHVVDQAQQLTDTQLVTARKYVTLANNRNTV
jgi:hypothetical protein